MSDEKIDLAKVVARAEYELEYNAPSEFACDVLALVAAVRAARAYIYVDVEDMDALEAVYDAAEAALASFTDSAEVPNG